MLKPLEKLDAETILNMDDDLILQSLAETIPNSEALRQKYAPAHMSVLPFEVREQIHAHSIQMFDFTDSESNKKWARAGVVEKSRLNVTTSKDWSKIEDTLLKHKVPLKKHYAGYGLCNHSDSQYIADCGYDNTVYLILSHLVIEGFADRTGIQPVAYFQQFRIYDEELFAVPYLARNNILSKKTYSDDLENVIKRGIRINSQNVETNYLIIDFVISCAQHCNDKDWILRAHTTNDCSNRKNYRIKTGEPIKIYAPAQIKNKED